MRNLAVHVDTICINPDIAAVEIETGFTVPILNRVVRMAEVALSGPVLDH